MTRTAVDDERAYAMRILINGATVEASGFIWDQCHKFYLIDSDSSLQDMLRVGYSESDVVPISELPQAWADSCPLRFISSGDLSVRYVEQGEDAELRLA